MRFYGSSISAAMFYDPCLHSEDFRFLSTVLRPGDTYIDVGANAGCLALHGANLVGPAGRVLVIEPNPRTYTFLTGSIALNNMHWVSALHAAVDARVGIVHITNRQQGDMNCVSDDGGEVRAVTLDSLQLDGAIRLLKSDPEGYDLSVLRGALDLLKRTHCVLVECSEWNLNRYHQTTAPMLQLLRDAGFDIFQMSAHDGGLTALPDDYVGRAGGNVVGLRASVTI